MKDKFILDACCGPKMMWFNKHHPNAIYIDIRREKVRFKYKRTEGHAVINPDIIMDYRNLKFPDNSFHLVVIDPPHIKSNTRSGILSKKFGGLNPETWQDDLKKALKECMRVLKPYGVLIFKWNDCSISLKDIKKIFPFEPLFYNISSGKHAKEDRSNTAWFTFMKIPKDK